VIEKIDIADFLDLYNRIPVFDVRSPGEFSQARIPCAYSLPLFTDEERKIVGSAYKQHSREQAIKLGLDFFGVKMRKMVEEVSGRVQNMELRGGEQSADAVGGKKKVLVHCWRGGMRSAGVAWLLDLYGFKVYTLSGGYKTFRKWVLNYLGQEQQLYILGGYTGSGKTEILHHLKTRGESIVDQEMFENELAVAIYKAAAEGKPIWIEDESQRIGRINIPLKFWQMMRNKPVYFIDVPFENRLAFIAASYGKNQQGELADAITRIQKRLGGLETKTALGYLLEENLAECFRILLHYYDKLYTRALTNRPASINPIITIPCLHPGAGATAERVLGTKQKTYA
jgi:tRNA 2-selenouridine synthase